MINFLDFNRHELMSFFEEKGDKKFYGEQIFKWIHQHGVTDFDAMTNLSLKLRKNAQRNRYH